MVCDHFKTRVWTLLVHEKRVLRTSNRLFFYYSFVWSYIIISYFEMKNKPRLRRSRVKRFTFELDLQTRKESSVS